MLLLSAESPIDFDGSLIFQFAIFFIAFFMLRALVFKPVMALFDARKAAMEGSTEAAVELEKQADATRDRFEQALRDVRQKATENRDKLRANAQQLARELTDKARRENNATLSSAKAQLELEARDARKRAEAEVPVLSQKIVERLLGRSVS